MANDNINITFTGSSAGLVNAASQVAKALNGVQHSSQQMGAASAATGVAMGTMMATLATKALSMAKGAMGAFSSVTGEVRKMQAILGGTAEDMSRLRTAGKLVGVESSTITRSMALLSTHLVKNDDAWKKLGVAAYDANGKMKPSTQLLGEVSDKLNAMGKGLERTSTARSLFGRGFAEINPLLAKGSEGIAHLAEESDKLGLTLTETDLKSGKAFKEAMNGLKASVEGVWVSIGRALTPTIALLAGVMKDAVAFAHSLFNSTGALGTAARIAAGTIGALAAAVLIYKGSLVATTVATKAAALAQEAWTAIQIIAIGVTEGFTGVMAAFNLVLEANPVGLIVVAIVAFIGVVIALVKNFSIARTVLTWVFTSVGAVIGAFVSAAILGFQLITGGFALMIKGLAMGASWIGKKLHIGWLESAGEGVNNMVNKIESGLKNAALKAPGLGAKIGNAAGRGLGNAIKDMKLPSFKLASPTSTEGGYDTNKPPTGTGKDAAAALKKFWTDKLNLMRDALQAVKKKADEAQKQFDDLKKSISDTMSKAFDITGLVEGSYAKYLGADALTAMFRRKLADAKEFVADLKILKANGLPIEMLQQIAAAGVEGGLDSARLLASNPGTIKELQGIQTEINSAASEAGTIVADATYGQSVTQTANAVAPVQAAYNAGVSQATAAGVDTSSFQADVAPVSVSVTAQTNADPAQIAADITHAIKTRTPPKTVPRKPKPPVVPHGARLRGGF